MAGTKTITENGAKSIASVYVEKCKRGMEYREALDEIEKKLKQQGYNPASRSIVISLFIGEYYKR